MLWEQNSSTAFPAMVENIRSHVFSIEIGQVILAAMGLLPDFFYKNGCEWFLLWQEIRLNAEVKLFNIAGSASLFRSQLSCSCLTRLKFTTC